MTVVNITSRSESVQFMIVQTVLWTRLIDSIKKSDIKEQYIHTLDKTRTESGVNIFKWILNHFGPFFASYCTTSENFQYSCMVAFIAFFKNHPKKGLNIISKMYNFVLHKINKVTRISKRISEWTVPLTSPEHHRGNKINHEKQKKEPSSTKLQRRESTNDRLHLTLIILPLHLFPCTSNLKTSPSWGNISEWCCLPKH